MSSPRDTFDAVIPEMIEKIGGMDDLHSKEASDAIKNFVAFSNARPPVDPEPDPTPEIVILTKRDKVKAAVSSVWDNETTRVLIKSGGAFAGVAIVVYTTIKNDHVIERQAMSQATQRNS